MLFVGPRDSVKTAIDIMRRHDVSQVPVILGRKILGSVSERQLLTGLYEKSIGPSNHIASVCDPHITIVSHTESIDRVSELLTRENFVVVVDDTQHPLGVVTRIDIIEYYAIA